MQIRFLANPQQLRAAAGPWDDLWQRSAVTVPRARAELVALWGDHFAVGKVEAVAIEHEGRFVAALPLVRQRVRRVFPTLTMPRNAWADCGDLLLDPAVDEIEVLDLLIAALRSLRRAIWFDEIPLAEARWKALIAAAERAGWLTSTRQHYEVAQIEIGSDWEAYEATRKGDHRRSRRRYSRMLEEAGETKLHVFDKLTPDEVDPLLRRGFEVEDRSWKGAQSTSVLKVPGMYEFYLHEARQLATWNQLELVFLEHAGQPIAFDYGFNSKGVHFTPKLGYDDAFSKYGPGQQMMMRLLERLHADPSRTLLDFWGPLATWSESWATRTYPVGRLVMAPDRGLNRGLFHAYEHWQPRLRAVRDWIAPRLKRIRPKT